MTTLVKIFPLMVGRFVEEENEHWECFLMLWDICKIVLGHDFTESEAVHLEWMVETYLESFVELYGAEKMTPKTHHLVHLSLQILL